MGSTWKESTRIVNPEKIMSMFSDRHAADVIEFPSCWRKSLSVKDSECQSEDQKMHMVEVQAVSTEEAETQTEENHAPQSSPEEQLNRPSLVKFLAMVTPIMEEELLAASRSRAFDGYEPSSEGTDNEVRKLHTLVNNNQENIRVSALTWSSSGSVLALSYEMEHHSDWCDHLTQLCIWNLSRRDFDPDKPYKSLPASSCLTMAKFHPKDPGYVIGGGFTGEIYLWSISRDQDPLVASSSMAGHRERISSLHWINAFASADGSLRHTQILSTALDGKMILWNIDSSSQSLVPSKRFWTPVDHLPRSLNTKVRSQAELGITCLDVNVEDQTIIIFGTEAGAVFQGSLSAILPVPSPDKEEDDGPEYLDPVSVSFAPHRGRVLDVKCSPFARDLFLSLGSDREVRLWSLLQPHSPLTVLYPEGASTITTQWSPFRPSVLAMASSQGELQLFDLRLMTSKPTLVVKATERSTAVSAFSTLAFNSTSGGWIGVGDAFGRAHIWKLPSNWNGTDQQSQDLKWIHLLLSRIQEE